MKKALNFLFSRVRLAWWRVRGWKKFAEDELFVTRLSICSGCPFNNQKKEECRLCGCPIIAKTALASEKCPVDYWPRQKIRR